MDFKKIKVFINPDLNPMILNFLVKFEYFFGNSLGNIYYNMYEEELPQEPILLISTFKELEHLLFLNKTKVRDFLNYNKILLMSDLDMELQWIQKNNQLFSDLNMENIHRVSDVPNSNADIEIECKCLILTDINGINLINQKRESNNGKFFCLMNVDRPHRSKLTESLYEKNLLTKGKVVFHECKNENIKKFLHQQIKGEDLKDFNMPIHNNWVDGQIGKEYLNYGLEIVAETRSDIILISEKTIRPLSVGMPFLMVSAPKTLEHLHHLGFETYGKHIDQSYDNELDLDKRIDQVTDRLSNLILKDIFHLYDSTRDIAAHNLENLFKIRLDYESIFSNKLYNWIKNL